MAKPAARERSVALGTPKKVRGPLVMALQCTMMVCRTTRSAKEVMTAAASDNLING